MGAHQHKGIQVHAAAVPALAMLLALLWLPSGAQTITVKQDGTGMFTAIQDAIDAAVSGDTILVWPGTYYENLDFNEKSLTLGSLTLTTGNISYRDQTIIDGGHSSSCVLIEGQYGQNIAFAINGFTIQNGYRTYGGGFLLDYAVGEISNCIIQDNIGTKGGAGLSVVGVDLFFSNCIIRNNYSYGAGGGIGSGISLIVFDSINRCSMYNNYGLSGTEIYKVNSIYPLHVYMDTFMVARPDRYHIFAAPDSSGNTFSFDGWHHKVEQTAETLYVSPQGDNAHSGLSPEEPLKNTWLALVKARPLPGQPQTIRLLEGTYSCSTTGERLPLGLKDSVSIVGAGQSESVIDAELTYKIISGIEIYGPVTLKNLSFINGSAYKAVGGDGRININYNYGSIVLDSLRIANCYDFNIGGIQADLNENLLISNCEFESIHGIPLWVSVGDYGSIRRTSRLSHIKVTNTCTPIPNSGYYFNPVWLYSYMPESEDSKNISMINCQVTDNTDSTNQGYVSRGALVLDQVNANIINCSFANNRALNSQSGASFNIQGLSTVNIYNSIFYQNQPTEFGFYAPEGNRPTVNIHNSLVLGGTNSFFDPGEGNLYYDPTNIDTDPLFTGYGEFPYALSGLSPCIDAGTMDLPEGISLPATDLAGNPRVWGGSVDMGAYEFNPVSIGESRLQPQTVAHLTAMPNPFTHEISITAQLTTAVSVRITVHNLLGREVACLMEQTDNRLSLTSLQWDGRSSTGDILPAGVYLVSLSENNKPVASLRVVKE
ncbi:MAG: T9SS type A sorting domain-containing protein [Bacteroidales bacterium]|nr:T9SS type A sorting domain-containing protein [Bacteroidales bacterium]